MDNLIKATSAKRFVVENSIIKVTSDGEPHELMTMVAGLAGLLVAVVILAVLVSMVACHKTKSLHTKSAATSVAQLQQQQPAQQQQRNGSINSIDSSLTLTAMHSPIQLLHGNFHAGSASNLAGNLNDAFADCEFDLSDTLRLGKQRQQPMWQASVAAEGQTRETYIQVERY